MIQKILFPIIALVAQFLISWYGWYSGKLPVVGKFLGLEYDSVFVRSFITQLQFVWFLIIVNFLFSLAFNIGLGGYKNFLVVMIIWISAWPISALLFNMIF